MSSQSKSMVIGASGLIGSWLMNELGDCATGTSHSQTLPGLQKLDIRDGRAVEELLRRFEPETIYCPAARPAVDWCEEHPQESYETNVHGIENVARAAARAGTRLVFFSSDYVFDGCNGPYSEQDEPSPICVYGRQKVQAEQIVRELLPDEHIIIRTTVVYGWEKAGKNFVFRLVQSLRQGKRLRVPADQVGSPTYAVNLARTVIELAHRKLVGTWNVCGPACMDRYEFSMLAAEVFGLDGDLIQPVTTAELHQTASRPLRAGMKVDKIKSVPGTTLVEPKAGLEDMYNSEGNLQK